MLVKVFIEVAAVVADRLSPFKHLAGGVQVVFLHALASLEFLMSLGFFGHVIQVIQVIQKMQERQVM